MDGEAETNLYDVQHKVRGMGFGCGRRGIAPFDQGNLRSVGAHPDAG